MNSDILDPQLFKELVANDSKTLTQKALKTAEEVGELAKVILPFENAAGTLHRFAVKQQILEEAIDVILCAGSIIESMEFSEAEIQEMFERKMKKWQGLQAAEGRIDPQKIPYEIHVTVTPQYESYSNPIEVFIRDCEYQDLKPIVLDLQNKSNIVVIQDVMTSTKMVGTNKQAYEEACRIENYFRESGYCVPRVKIETVPWHPAAPQHYSDEMPGNCYFECHLGVIVDSSADEDKIKQLNRDWNFHISRNVFKKVSDTASVKMITIRDGSCYTTFKQYVEDVKTELNNMKFPIEREIIEFAIYDTDVSHDSAWINSNETSTQS